MTLSEAASETLSQLAVIVDRILPQDFSKPSEALGGSTIGQHIRHTLEFFTCLQRGYENGTVNYDERPHDHQVQSDKEIALESLKTMITFISNLQDDRPLSLQVSYDSEGSRFHTVKTTLMREVVYNIEHAVHHMALIRIGLSEVAPYVQVGEGFGIAASTVRYNRSIVPEVHQ